MNPSGENEHPAALRVGVVVIGRNEGERLVAALHSVRGLGCPVVYVDSGSSDGSAERARSFADAVLELDAGGPYTAARGRNEGHAFLRSRHPGIEAVQFVDGDTVLAPDWLQRGIETLRRDPLIAAVAGRLDEGHGDADRYARLLRMEWAAAAGDTDAVGGIALYRSTAFEEVGGFAGDLHAGEEPELCGRLRRAGYRVVRIGTPMGVHHGDIGTFSAWWRRAVRSGEASFECARRGGRQWAGADFQRITSALGWGVLVPLLGLAFAGAAIWSGRPEAAAGVAGATGALYAVQWWRIRGGRVRRGEAPADAGLFATHCLLAKPAEALGIARAAARRGRLAERSRTPSHDSRGAPEGSR